MPRLIDADALKEDLTRFYDNEVTARELIDEQPTVGGWISVKDRMPEEETLVIALVKYNSGLWYRIFAWYDKKGWASSQEEFSEQDGEYIAYWMPLPELPEE